MATEPFTLLALVVMAVGGKGVAVRTERSALGIIATCETGSRILVDLVMAQREETECPQVVIDVAQDVVVGFAGITSDFADVEIGETAAQIVKTGNGLEMVVAVGGDEGGREGPVGEEAVIKNIEGLGFVAEMVLSLGRGALLLTLVVRRCRLCLGAVVALIVDVACVRVAGCGTATVVATSLGVTVPALFACCLCGTGALRAGEETGGTHLGTAHT